MARHRGGVHRLLRGCHRRCADDQGLPVARRSLFAGGDASYRGRAGAGHGPRRPRCSRPSAAWLSVGGCDALRPDAGRLEQATAFLIVANTHRLGALFSVALACGLRLGEATGLRWADVDLESGRVEIRQQLQRVGKRLVLQELKTEKSRRTLMLPDVCVKALRDHRKRQLAERLKAGADWVDTGLVFATYARRGRGRKVGAPLGPRNVLRTLHGLLEAAEPKLPRVRFHDLRHSAASLLIAAGVELVEVSMLLGHSELRVTADLYSHLQQQTAARAARHMDAVLQNVQGVS
jgi:integrase